MSKITRRQDLVNTRAGRLTETEKKEFIWWISLIVFAGGLPNLFATIPAIGDLILIAAVSLAGGRLLVDYLRQRRRRGVAALVHLPAMRGDDRHEVASPDVLRILQAKHQAWFRAGPEPAEFRDDPARRVRWVVENIRFRISDVDELLPSRKEVWLYLKCRQPDAFTLGSVVTREIETTDSEPWISTVSLGVAQISQFRGEVSLYRLALPDFSGASPQPSRPVFLSTDLVDTEIEARRLAIVVYATDSNSDSLEDPAQSFFRGALNAMKVPSESRYRIRIEDRCDRALLLKMDWGLLKQSLEDATAGPVVEAIRGIYKSVSRDTYQSDDIAVSLFLQGPPILAFAFGAFLPPGSRLMEWVPGSIQFTSGRSLRNMTQIAIIDGDDIGEKIESLLLASDLTSAIDCSTAITEAFAIIVHELSMIEGVLHLSTGGDSVMFSVDLGVLDVFQSTIESLRERLFIRFSCGVGSTLREAFVALRIAKTTGKGRTVSYTSQDS